MADKVDKKIVFVGLSGGVDSAVSATLLKKAGYDVVGVFIKTWHPDFLECNEEEERRDAMRVSAHLDIPFLTFDLEDVYKKEVADYMISEYKMGRTPNPDVMCNKEVKFGAFLKKAISMGALVRPSAEIYVATGHYAQEFPSPLIRGRLGGGELKSTSPQPSPYKGEGEMRLLQKGVDPFKDQSYFLWTLRQEQLKKILFPIGHLKKTEVRALAKKFKLPVAEKKDSQGICFLGAVDLKEFLKHYIKEKKGKVKNEKGEEIGYHDGVFFHTLGERHGFTITKKNPNDGPYYIVSKDVKKNVLVVAQNTPSLIKEGVGGGNSPTTPHSPPRAGGEVKLKNTNWIYEIPIENKIYSAQIRYHSECLPCKVKIKSKTKAEIIFQKQVSGLPAKTLVAAGQSCVLYDGDVCLGGGIVV